MVIGVLESMKPTYGAKIRIFITRASSHGQLRVKQYEAIIRKIVVGIPGTIAPIAAQITAKIPSKASAIRFGFRNAEEFKCAGVIAF